MDGPETPHRSLPHLRSDGAVYFVTSTTHLRGHLSDRERDEVLAACLHWNGTRAHVLAAVVMHDHVHLLIQPVEPHSLSSLMHSIKSFSAHRIAAMRGARGVIWAPESMDRTVRGEAELLALGEYIVANPVRAGLVQEAEQYPWLRVGGFPDE